MTIDPNSITMTMFKSSVLTGNILSVGTDGIYTYDYSHPQTAYNAASSGDTILIYPGTYSTMTNYGALYLNRGISIYIRGMGDSVDSVVLTNPADYWHGIIVEHSAPNIRIAIENLKATAYRAWSSAVVCRECSSSTVVYLNKVYAVATNYGYVISFGEPGSVPDYKGDCYITNCTILRGYSTLREVGQGSLTSIISVEKSTYLGGTYYCDTCLRNPSPNNYVTVPTINYGSSYGKFFISTITAPINRQLESIKRNIFYKEPYLYRATTSGVVLYDVASEEQISYVPFSQGANAVWANDDYIYISTSVSGICRCPVATIYSSPFFEGYKSLPDITSNNVNYLHGSNDYLCVSTASGVDRYRFSDDTREYIIEDNVGKCFQTSNGDYYYVVNPFYNILGLDGNVFDWNYGRKITLSSGILVDNYPLLFEIPYEVYSRSQTYGNDIRIIDDKGVRLHHNIYSWDNVTPPILFTLLLSGTNEFYVLYGNPATSYDNVFIEYSISTSSGHVVDVEQSVDDLLNASELHVVYSTGGDHTYISKQQSLLRSNYISDIYVTEETSSYPDSNVIFLATSWGALAIEEKRGDEDNSSKKIYLVSD